MRKKGIVLGIFAVAIAAYALPAYALATPTSYVYGTSDGRQGNNSITSTTTPVNVMPSAPRGTFRVCNRSTSVGPVLCGDYSGTLPTSAGANWEEIPVGQCRSDGKDADITLNLAWACVCESSSCAGVVDSTWR